MKIETAFKLHVIWPIAHLGFFYDGLDQDRFNHEFK